MLFRAFFRDRHWLVLTLLALGVGVGILEGLFVLIIKSALAPGFLAWGPAVLVLAAFAAVTVRSVLQLAMARIETTSVIGWTAGLRAGLLDLAGQRQFPAYRDPYRGALAWSLDRGLQDLNNGTAAGIRCFSAAAQAAVLMPLLFLFSWKPALAALLLALPVLWLSRFRSLSLAAAAHRWSGSTEALAADVEGFVEGLESDAGNGRLPHRASALSRAQARHEEAARQWEMSKALYPPLLEWMFFAALAALLALAALARGAGAAWPASLLPFAALLLLLYRPIREWARAFPARLPGDRAWSAYRNLRDTLSAFPDRPVPGTAPGRHIVFEALRFGYTSGRPDAGAHSDVFLGLDAEVDPAALTWIPGPNGTGKSTFLKLLAGIEAPREGRILLPAALLERPTPFAYLSQRALVEPDYLQWAGSYSREHPGDWRILDAILGLSSLIAKCGGNWPLPDAAHQEPAASNRGFAASKHGLAASQRGFAASLSGGERQRLGLARAFASPAGCLLLDEPTTYLSAGDRERIMGDLIAFWRREPGRGALMVSHEAFLGEFCSCTLRLDQAAAGIARKRSSRA